jgi:hypothetical protein
VSIATEHTIMLAGALGLAAFLLISGSAALVERKLTKRAKRLYDWEKRKETRYLR